MSFKTSVIRIEVDCTAAGTWCEIDAVELVGDKDDDGTLTSSQFSECLSFNLT